MKASCERPVGDVEQATAATHALIVRTRLRLKGMAVSLSVMAANINPLGFYRYQARKISTSSSSLLATIRLPLPPHTLSDALTGPCEQRDQRVEEGPLQIEDPQHRVPKKPPKREGTVLRLAAGPAIPAV